MILFESFLELLYAAQKFGGHEFKCLINQNYTC